MSFRRRTTIRRRPTTRFFAALFMPCSLGCLFLPASDTMAQTNVRKSRLRKENAISINIDRRSMGSWYSRYMEGRGHETLEITGVFCRQENSRSSVLHRRRAAVSKFYPRSLAISGFEPFIAAGRKVSDHIIKSNVCKIPVREFSSSWSVPRTTAT